MQLIKKNKLLLLLLFIGVFLRFYNLNWGAPYYFHPDERQNVVYPILQSQSIFMLDQKNFDTGTFPLIVIKIIYSSIKNFIPAVDPTQLVILISRFASALISITISLLLYLIVKKIFGEKQALFAFILSIFSTGLIQFAHFGTIELWEALFFLILFYFAWKVTKSAKLSDSIISGILLGFAVSTKVLSLILTPALLSSYLLFFYHKYKTKTKISKNLQKSIIGLAAFGITALLAFGLTSLPMLTNFTEARHSINFESDVALGSLPVFYTQGFYDTIPIEYQFTKVFPFLLNPLITIVFAISLVYVLFLGIKKRNFNYLLVSIFFLLLFVSQSFFFVKWTRYMIPTLPFIYIIIGVAFGELILFAKKRLHRTLLSVSVGTCIFVSFIFSISFFITAYQNPSTPVTAGNFAKNNIPPGSIALTEPFDLGITAFPQNIIKEDFNFYELGNSQEYTPEILKTRLQTSDYIILTSQRLLRSRIQKKSRFPKGNNFYSGLMNGKLGFAKIYQTPCDIFCKISYFGDPIFGFEETAIVFDRPTVMIFKKN